MEEEKKTFIEELQALDESVKRRILTVSTIVVVAVVAYAWIGYFNSLVVGSSEQATAVATTPTATVPGPTVQGDSQSFWQGMENDMADIGNTLRGPGQYSVKPQ